MGVSPWIEMTVFSPMRVPAQLGSSTSMRSLMNASSEVPSSRAVRLRLPMSLNAPWGSSRKAGRTTWLVSPRLKALAVMIRVRAIDMFCPREVALTP